MRYRTSFDSYTLASRCAAIQFQQIATLLKDATKDWQISIYQICSKAVGRLYLLADLLDQ
jgi:hypothetical protein